MLKRPQRAWGTELAAYLGAIVAAELVTVFKDPLGGILAHIAILAVTIIRASRAEETYHRHLILSLALVPLVRIISLSMPLTNLPQIYWYPIMYIPLVVGGVLVMKTLGFSKEDVGIRLNTNLRSIPLQIAVAISGFGLGMAEYIILRPEPIVFTLPMALVLGISTGFVEEFIFRGVLQHSAWGRGGWWGIAYVSVIFAILHIGFLSWVDVIFVFGVAMYFAWVVKKTGSLLAASLAHAITNITLFFLAPFVL